MFDSHAHYDDDAFDRDRDDLLNRLFQESGVTGIINAGCDIASSDTALLLAAKYPKMYAAVGIHPENASQLNENVISKLKEMLKDKKAVAIGEIGLDYHYDTPEREVQKYAFRRQMELAGETGFPVIIHDRDAHADCIETVLAFPDVKGVFHSFSGSAESAELLIKHGWYISVGGVVTFKNARQLPEVVKAVPIDRILIETDAPYLSPVPFRGKRNDSSLMSYTIEKIALIKELSFSEVEAKTEENARILFGI